jgi:hypothetical protein
MQQGMKRTVHHTQVLADKTALKISCQYNKARNINKHIDGKE